MVHIDAGRNHLRILDHVNLLSPGEYRCDFVRGGVHGGPELPVARGGLEIDPLVGLDDPSKPLRSKLLAVPALRAKYLAHVKELAEQWLDWTGLELRADGDYVVPGGVVPVHVEDGHGIYREPCVWLAHPT